MNMGNDAALDKGLESTVWVEVNQRPRLRKTCGVSQVLGPKTKGLSKRRDSQAWCGPRDFAHRCGDVPGIQGTVTRGPMTRGRLVSSSDGCVGCCGVDTGVQHGSPTFPGGLLHVQVAEWHSPLVFRRSSSFS